MLNPSFVQVTDRQFRAIVATETAKDTTKRGRGTGRELKCNICDRDRNYWDYTVRYVLIAQRVDSLSQGRVIGSYYFVDPKLAQ
jgi:hypothetical protein